MLHLNKQLNFLYKKSGLILKKNLKNIVGGHYDRTEQQFKMLNLELSVNMLRIPCLFKIVLFCLKINFEYNHMF